MKRLLAFLLAVSLTCMPFPAKAAEEDARLAELRGKYDTLEDQQKLIETQIGKARTEKDRQVAAIQQIGAQIDATAEQVQLLNERVALLQTRIGRMEAVLDDQQDEIDKRYGIFKDRLNALVRFPRVNNLGIALGTSSYFEFITSETIVRRAAAYDRKLLDGLREEQKALEGVKREIEESRNQVERDRALLGEKQQELGRKLAETQRQVQDLALLEQQIQVNGEALSRQMKQVEAEMETIYAGIASKSDLSAYVGGGSAFATMIRPTPNLTQITSAYGWRFGNSNFHTGADFSGAGAYGQPIVAACAGKVAFVNTTFTPGYGYGKYVILDHGGGITTLYAHCSAINVQVGQTVAQGETIAQVGSTGWSTGPHCHFEVRVGGKHTNPMPYLKNA